MRRNSTTKFPAPRALTLFVAYEDFEAGCHAESLCNHLGRAEGCDLDLKLWRFDMLQEISARIAAHSDAADADVVVVSWSSSGPLPNDVLLWLEQWANGRLVRDVALAALPAGARSGSDAGSPAFESLRRIAANHGITLLCDWSGGLRDLPEDLWNDLQSRVQTVTPTLNRILEAPHNDPYTHWGLND